MARNIKQDVAVSRFREKRTISATLTRKGKMIWDAQVKNQNMSKWLDTQLKFHYGDELTPEQQKALLREDIATLNRWKGEQDKQIQAKFNGMLKELQEMRGFE